jgi:hypothetical protein
MSFSDGSEFERQYGSLESLKRALKRQLKQGHSFSAEGMAAIELLEIVGGGIALTTAAAAAGAKIGMYFGPKGVAIGALIGTSIGLITTYYAAEWYVSIKRHRDGSITAVFTPL